MQHKIISIILFDKKSGIYIYELKVNLFATDRKGHDLRYAIDPTKIKNDLGWEPDTMFDEGIVKTVNWYLENREWWETILRGEYQNYYEKMYGKRDII